MNPHIMFKRDSFSRLKDMKYPAIAGHGELVVDMDNGNIVWGDGQTPVYDLSVSGKLPEYMFERYGVKK